MGQYRELVPRVSFIITNSKLTSDEIVKVYNGCGEVKNRIKQGTNTSGWDKTICHSFDANYARLKIGVLAYNLLHNPGVLCFRRGSPAFGRIADPSSDQGGSQNNVSFMPLTRLHHTCLSICTFTGRCSDMDKLIGNSGKKIVDIKGSEDVCKPWHIRNIICCSFSPIIPVYTLTNALASVFVLLLDNVLQDVFISKQVWKSGLAAWFQIILVYDEGRSVIWNIYDCFSSHYSPPVFSFPLPRDCTSWRRLQIREMIVP